MTAKDDTNHITVAGFIFVDSKPPRFLILKRNELLGGFWQPVTGRVEEDETPMAALKREVKEETGLDGFERILDLNHSYPFRIGQRKYQELCFGMEALKEEKVLLSEEHTEYLWADYFGAVSTLHYREYKEALSVLHRLITR